MRLLAGCISRAIVVEVRPPHDGGSDRTFAKLEAERDNVYIRPDDRYVSAIYKVQSTVGANDDGNEVGKGDNGREVCFASMLDCKVACAEWC